MNFEQTKDLLIMLNTEYPGMLTESKVSNNAKTNLWTLKLQKFCIEEVMNAVSVLLDQKIYGKPNISDLMEILNPVNNIEAQAQAITDRFIKLCNKTKDLVSFNKDGTIIHVDEARKMIEEELGTSFANIYDNVENQVRYCDVENITVIKSQIRKTITHVIQSKNYTDRKKEIGSVEELLKLEVKK
jgi:hypothetical protein